MKLCAASFKVTLYSDYSSMFFEDEYLYAMHSAIDEKYAESILILQQTKISYPKIVLSWQNDITSFL